MCLSLGTGTCSPEQLPVEVLLWQTAYQQYWDLMSKLLGRATLDAPHCSVRFDEKREYRQCAQQQSNGRHCVYLPPIKSALRFCQKTGVTLHALPCSHRHELAM